NRRSMLEFRRGTANDQLSQDESAYRQSELFRVASYDRVIGNLQLRAQNFDPRGSTALRYADLINQARGARAQALNAYQQGQFKDTLEGYKATTERLRELETQRHNMAEEGFKAAKLGAGTGGG